MRYAPTLFAEGFLFPESPRWDGGAGRFYVADIDRGEIHEVPLDAPPSLLFKSDDLLSGYASDGAGGFIATSLLQRKLLHLTPDGGSFTAREAADASALASFALNDLIRTSAGYTYVATLDFNFVDFVSGKTEARPSPIVGMSPEGTVFVATTEVTFPNGMAATPGDDRLLVADTLDACIYAFTIAKDGALVNRRVFASLPREAPDGMCLDAEGAVWVATHHRVLRVLEGGAITDEVEMGTPLATACMLGGADGRTLLVTASDSFDRRVISKTPSGRLFTVRVPVPGGGLPSTYA